MERVHRVIRCNAGYQDSQNGGPEWVGRWEAVGWIKEKAAILPPLFVPDSLSPSRVGGGITSFLWSLIRQRHGSNRQPLDK